ncbi:hypothetical protein Tco_0837876 [Tanacetum coccineum]
MRVYPLSHVSIHVDATLAHVADTWIHVACHVATRPTIDPTVDWRSTTVDWWWSGSSTVVVGVLVDGGDTWLSNDCLQVQVVAVRGSVRGTVAVGGTSVHDQPGQGEGPSSPGGTQHTSTLIETSPQLQNISNTYRKTRTRTRRMGIRIPQSDVPSSVADEAIIKEMHDGLVRATTTASSLEAEQGSGNIAKTQTKATSSGPSSPRTSSEGGPGCHFTMGDIPVQARPERVSNLPNEPPLREGNTSRSGEGSMQLLELINLCTKLSDKVTSLEDELASTKAVYNKALITLTKRVKKLEKQLKHKKRRAVIDSSEDEGPSLDAEDSPKQGRMIEEIDKDETVNLVKSRELGKSHDTAEHRMESEHDDDDRTLAETLLNIKRSAAKGKAIMQESEPPKKIKKKEMIQISLDEEFAKSFYEEEQAQILQDEVYAKQVEAQWIADEERIPQKAKQTDEREKVINWNDPNVLRYNAVQNRPFSKAEVRKNMCTYLKNQGGYKMSHFKGMSYEDIRYIFERVWDQNQAFVSKDSKIEKEVIKRPRFDLQQESSKKAGGSRKKTLARKRAGETQSDQSAKRQKMKDNAEKEDFKEYLNIVPEEGMNVEALQTKYPLIDWEIYTEDSRVFSSTEPDNDKEKALWVELKRLFEPDTDDLLELQRYMHDPLTWRLYVACGVHHVSTETGLDMFMLVDKDYPLTRGLPMLMLVNKLQADQHSEMADELLKKIFILANRPRQ